MQHTLPCLVQITLKGTKEAAPDYSALAKGISHADGEFASGTMVEAHCLGFRVAGQPVVYSRLL